jgi:hypothetical protein
MHPSYALRACYIARRLNTSQYSLSIPGYTEIQKKSKKHKKSSKILDYIRYM